MSPVSRARADAKTQLMLDTLARDIESHPEKLRTVDEQLVDRMVAVSGYDHPLMDELFKPVQWFKTFSADKSWSFLLCWLVLSQSKIKNQWSLTPLIRSLEVPQAAGTNQREPPAPFQPELVDSDRTPIPWTVI